MSATNGKKVVQFTIGEDSSTVILDGATVEISADAKRVTAYTDNGVEVEAAAANSAEAAEGTHIDVSKDFNTVVLRGVTIRQAADRHLTISAPGGKVFTKERAANDTAKTFNKVAVGEARADGWVLKGPDPDQPSNDLWLEPEATRLGTTSWYKFENHVKDLQKGLKTADVPSVQQLVSVFKDVVKPGKNGTAKLVTDSSSVAGWHWSREANPDPRGYARIVSIADGDTNWGNKGNDALSAVAVSSEPRP